jgi:hypothetical protein
MGNPAFIPSSNVNLEQINEPGDLITEAIVIMTDKGEAINITNFVMETVLFEDIFSNTMMGHVYIKDATNLITKIPLVGTETITLSFRTPTFTDSIRKTFKITSIDDRIFTKSDVEQGYTISFMSMEAFIDNVTNLTKKFVGTTDEVVKKIFTEYLSVKRLVGSSDSSNTPVVTSGNPHGSSVSFVACSWSPLKCINWVAHRSFINSTEAPSFLFFETNKSFRFASIEELIEKQKTKGGVFAEYTYAPTYSAKTIRPNSKYLYSKPELTKQYNIVRNIAPYSYFNVLDGQDFGYYAGTMITQDYILKTYQEYPVDYYNSYKDFKHLGDPTNQSYPSKMARDTSVKNVVRTKAYKLHNDQDDPMYEKWMIQRNSLLFEATKFHIEIEVPGRTDIEVGVLIDFLYPKAIDKNDVSQEENALDPFISGLYLVTAIRHSFKLNKHTMFLEMMKDSFKNPV